MQEKEEAQEASQNLLVDGKNLVIVIVMRHRKIETAIEDEKGAKSIHESKKRIGKRISAKGRKGVDTTIMANG